MWISRTIKNRILRSCESRPVVLLTGARQSGKSSLLKRLFSAADYVTLDKIQKAEEAEENPEYFLNKFQNRVVIDEVQYAPSIFRELKILVDENRNKYGKWILTGSQKFTLMKKVSESLAGRVTIITLETLSSKEIRESGFFTEDKVKDSIWKGGYPELYANSSLDSKTFFEDYIQTYLERDLKSIINVSSLRDFQRFFKICSLRIGQLINFTQISSDVGVSNNTIKSWISALEASGIIYLLPPYFDNMGKRIVKAPKLYFADTGLASYFLGINSYDQWILSLHKGQIWENYTFSEMLKTLNLIPGRDIFFYRDQNGVEMDFLVEKNNTLYFIESKASEIVNKNKLNFKKLENAFKNRKNQKNILLSQIQNSSPVKLNNYTAVNPLLCDLNLEEKSDIEPFTEDNDIVDNLNI